MGTLDTRPTTTIDPIFIPSSIRRGANVLFGLAERDALEHFRLNQSKLSRLATNLAQSINPIAVQPHTQWRNLEHDGVRRIAELNDQLMRTLDTSNERVRARLDLLFLNEALETGGNGSWKYYDSLSDKFLTRTEALATATLRLFQNGFFSSEPHTPLRVDTHRLRSISDSELADAFQISHDNQMLGGIGAKHQRLAALADYLECQTEFLDRTATRPGNILNVFSPSNIPLEPLFSFLAKSLTTIWPGNLNNGSPLGDAWPHRALDSDPVLQGIAPIHRITQWLHYAIAPALTDYGFTPISTIELTGLPGYRNTGLLVDVGVIIPRNPALFSSPHLLGDEAIVELRCLTISAMDRVLLSIHQHHNLSHDSCPMAKLNGLFWHAGRTKAAELRPDGSPPFVVKDQGVPF